MLGVIICASSKWAAIDSTPKPLQSSPAVEEQPDVSRIWTKRQRSAQHKNNVSFVGLLCQHGHLGRLGYFLLDKLHMRSWYLTKSTETASIQQLSGVQRTNFGEIMFAFHTFTTISPPELQLPHGSLLALQWVFLHISPTNSSYLKHLHKPPCASKHCFMLDPGPSATEWIPAWGTSTIFSTYLERFFWNVWNHLQIESSSKGVLSTRKKTTSWENTKPQLQLMHLMTFFGTRFSMYLTYKNCGSVVAPGHRGGILKISTHSQRVCGFYLSNFDFVGLATQTSSCWLIRIYHNKSTICRCRAKVSQLN